MVVAICHIDTVFNLKYSTGLVARVTTGSGVHTPSTCHHRKLKVAKVKMKRVASESTREEGKHELIELFFCSLK